MVGPREHASDCQVILPWSAGRKFIPAEHYGEDYDLDSNDYDSNGDVTNVPCEFSSCCPHCGNFERHLNEIFIAVDGTCKGNGGLNAYATTGVYFSRNSRWNKTGSLTDPRPTNQKAELTACLVALTTVPEVESSMTDGLKKVVIKSDSEYVVKGMTGWIFKWKKNGWKTSKGSTVVNATLYRLIEEMVHRLKTMGIEVLFWHVPRDRNKEADAIAISSLDDKLDDLESTRSPKRR